MSRIDALMVDDTVGPPPFRIPLWGTVICDTTLPYCPDTPAPDTSVIRDC